VAVSLFPLLLGARGGFSSAALLPASITLGVVVLSARVLPALLLGIAVGSAYVFGPAWAVPSGVHKYFIARVLNVTNLCISGFALSVLLTVKLAEASGGMRALILPITRRLRGVRDTQLGAALLGLLVFFDDYANTMLVGPAVRPITDRQGVSREKLAYIVDSTAAPVAGLAVVSTWVGYEVGLLEAARQDLGVSQGGYSLLLSALPQRFYCLFALALVFLIALSGRDFGPMLRAERAARKRAVGPARSDDIVTSSGGRWRWLNAALPITVLCLGVAFGFFIDGGGPGRVGSAPLGSLEFWRATLSQAHDGPIVLFCAGSAALSTALVGVLASGALDLVGCARALGAGVRTLALPIGILYCAWAIGDVSKDLHTGGYLVALLREQVSPLYLPLLTFLVAAAISFSTGTSWGTMAVLIPAALPLAHELGGLVLLVPTIAAILDGAIFGDHCSPISDTTLLSSAACECDALAHVWTQLPYAVLAMLVAAGSYLVLAATATSVLVAYGAGVTLLTSALWLIGRRAS
jgi:Na+/H+ antiporter NhaC